MRHQRHFTDVGERSQLLPDGMHSLRHKAQPIHTAIHFKIDIQRRMQFSLLQGFNLPVAVYAGGQTILIKQRQFIGVKEPFQQ